MGKGRSRQDTGGMKNNGDRGRIDVKLSLGHRVASRNFGVDHGRGAYIASRRAELTLLVAKGETQDSSIAPSTGQQRLQVPLGDDPPCISLVLYQLRSRYYE